MSIKCSFPVRFQLTIYSYSVGIFSNIFAIRLLPALSLSLSFCIITKAREQPADALVKIRKSIKIHLKSIRPFELIVQNYRKLFCISCECVACIYKSQFPPYIQEPIRSGQWPRWQTFLFMQKLQKNKKKNKHNWPMYFLCKFAFDCIVRRQAALTCQIDSIRLYQILYANAFSVCESGRTRI